MRCPSTTTSALRHSSTAASATSLKTASVYDGGCNCAKLAQALSMSIHYKVSAKFPLPALLAAELAHPTVCAVPNSAVAAEAQGRLPVCLTEVLCASQGWRRRRRSAAGSAHPAAAAQAEQRSTAEQPANSQSNVEHQRTRHRCFNGKPHRPSVQLAAVPLGGSKAADLAAANGKLCMPEQSLVDS